MTCWEYRETTFFYNLRPAEELNKLGTEGWELVYIAPAPSGGGMMQAFFKRPVDDVGP